MPFFFYLLHIPLITPSRWLCRIRLGMEPVAFHQSSHGESPARLDTPGAFHFCVWAAPSSLYLACRWYADLRPGGPIGGFAISENPACPDHLGAAPCQHRRRPGRRSATPVLHKGDFDYLGEWKFTSVSKEWGKGQGY